MRAGTWTCLLALSACAAPGAHLAGTSPRALGPGLSFEAPAGLELSLTEGPDFVVYHAHDAARGWGVGVYRGGYPSSFRGEGATFEMNVLLRRPVLWSRWQDADGVAHEETFVWRDGSGTHVFAHASSDAELDELDRTIRTLEDVDVYRTLPPCPPIPRTVPRMGQPLVEDAAMLAHAGVLDVRLVAPEREAWQRIVIRPDAEQLFRGIALAADATPAGRVYGLAGLHAVGADDADRLACALRPGDGESLELPSTCPTRSVPARAVHASAIAPRWERHWNGLAAHGATSHAPLTVRGGTLAIDLAIPAPSYHRRPVAIDPFAAPASGLLLSQNHDRWVDAVRDVCWLDGGGAAHCLLHEVPESIHGPTALAFRDSGGCALSATGERTCFAATSSWTREEARRCFVDVPDVEIRTYDDGPWARLFPCAWTVCGIHASTGALHRFRDEAADRFTSEPVDVRDVKATDGAFAGDRHGGLWDVADEERIAAFEIGIARVIDLDEYRHQALVLLRDGRVAVSAAYAAWLETSELELEPGPDGWHYVAEWRGWLSAGLGLVCWDHAGRGRCVTEVYDDARHTTEARVVDVPFARPTVLDGLVCSSDTDRRIDCLAITDVEGVPIVPVPLTIDLSRW